MFKILFGLYTDIQWKKFYEINEAFFNFIIAHNRIKLLTIFGNLSLFTWKLWKTNIQFENRCDAIISRVKHSKSVEYWIKRTRKVQCFGCTWELKEVSLGSILVSLSNRQVFIDIPMWGRRWFPVLLNEEILHVCTRGENYWLLSKSWSSLSKSTYFSQSSLKKFQLADILQSL